MAAWAHMCRRRGGFWNHRQNGKELNIHKPIWQSMCKITWSMFAVRHKHCVNHSHILIKKHCDRTHNTIESAQRQRKPWTHGSPNVHWTCRTCGTNRTCRTKGTHTTCTTCKTYTTTESKESTNESRGLLTISLNNIESNEFSHYCMAHRKIIPKANCLRHKNIPWHPSMLTATF